MDLLVRSGLAKSRSEARRNVEQGGVSIDSEPVNDIKLTFGEDDFVESKLLRRGKKNYIKLIKE